MKSRVAVQIFGVLTLVITLFASYIALFAQSKDGKQFFARLFRDVSRYKSRRRLFGKDAVGGLVPFLMKKEKEVKMKEFTDDDLHGTTMTLAELAEYDGRTEDTPIYVGLKGIIYDVSANREAYKPGSGYSCFVGRDAAVLYATGCCDKVCPGTYENLTTEEMEELASWLEFYQNHDKYKYIGRIIADPVDSLLAKELGQGEGASVTESKSK